MRTEGDARLEVGRIGDGIRNTLLREQAAYVAWEPGNGTKYELVIVPWESWEASGPTTFESQMGPGWVFIARLHTTAVYPVRLWELDGTARCPAPDYCGEKWARGSGADGCAIHILLAAIAGCEQYCNFADADVATVA